MIMKCMEVIRYEESRKAFFIKLPQLSFNMNRYLRNIFSSLMRLPLLCLLSQTRSGEGERERALEPFEAAAGAKPSRLCTSSADARGPRGRWSDYRRLHDELI